MWAVRLHAYGGPEVLVHEEAPLPLPAGHEVRLRVHAAAINPVDWKMRKGALHDRYPMTFPAILGRDVAGVIDAVGEGAGEWHVGDEVYGYCPVDRDGSYAEGVVIPMTAIAHKPRSLSLVEAASLPTAALTTYAALIDKVRLTASDRVLIHAAAGGVGTFAMQFAKYIGAYVYATGSERSAALLRSLGADTIIDYRKHDFESIARNLDIVLDAVGGETLERSFACLRPGGTLVSITASPSPARLKAARLRGGWVGARPDGARLGEVAALVEAGCIRPVIDRVLPLAEAAFAHRLSQQGHVHGKLVLEAS
jgi:NADPH:quinone reductase-like Zn-dependent oxidoreductase